MIMPKNVVCKKCNNLVNGWCEKVIDSPDPDMVRDCRHFWEKTNADRIRAMSDEELAEVLGKLVHCGGCPMRDNCKMDNLPCNNVLLEWLKQPAEDTP
jgi:hypothetical protein